MQHGKSVVVAKCMGFSLLVGLACDTTRRKNAATQNIVTEPRGAFCRTPGLAKKREIHPYSLQWPNLRSLR